MAVLTRGAPRLASIWFGRLLAACAPHPFLAATTSIDDGFNFPETEGRDGVLSTLDADIQVLSHAKDTCGIPPVQDAFDSAGALLTTIRVRSLLLRGCELQAHVSSGFDLQQTGLHRSWAIVRRCMQSSRPGVEGKTVG
jgi:hypothetical protein